MLALSLFSREDNSCRAKGRSVHLVTANLELIIRKELGIIGTQRPQNYSVHHDD
jgi:hypothetical protein